MKTPKISITIPNLNGAHFLKTCLNSLKAQTFKDFEVIIIDNGSTDESKDVIKNIYPETLLYKFSQNTGFSVAVNKGISLSNGKYIFLLNNDTELEKNCLKTLNNFLDKNENADFCATKMLYFYERDKIDIAGDILSIYGIAHKRGNGNLDIGQYEQTQRIFGACAGAAIYRKELFDKIGKFDKNFFAYLEDVDFSLRANLFGYKCYYVPQAIVYHVDGGTSKKINKFTEKLIIRNQLYLIYKNFPLILLMFLFPFLFIGQMRNILSAIKNKYIKILFKSYYDFFKYKKYLKKDKIFIQKNKKLNSWQIFKLLDKKYPFNIRKSIFGS